MENDGPELFSSAFASSLLESMASGVFTLDESGTITSWNPAMERISGYSSEEALWQKCTFLKFSSSFGKVCPTDTRQCGIYQYGKVDGRECFLYHKNGQEVPVIKSARLVINVKGKVECIVETITDMEELYKARREAEEANRRLGDVHRLDNIIGKSPAMQRIFSSLKAAAASDATILIQGESGTGKELVAGAIHFNSERRKMPFITVNCGALPESLLESELFGHVRGAFTGAIRDRAGRFEQADGGTLFLDEIGDISPFIQTKLLRVLQEREIERVGESRTRKVDIRIIAATNKDLFGLVKSGNFREDLYYRLKVFPITVPPLRDRKEDIPLLMSHLIEMKNQKSGKWIEGVSSEAARIIMDYSWPGNVRELENAIEHAFVLCTVKLIDVFDLPVEIRQCKYHLPSTQSVQLPEARRPREKLTKEKLIDLLKTSGWNKAEAARRLGLSRTSIWKYMKEWDIPLQR